MKVWVEIVAIDGRRIKNPIREDYEDHRDGCEEPLPARWAKMIYGRLE